MCFPGLWYFPGNFSTCVETAGIHLLSQQLPIVRAGFGKVILQIRFFAPPNFGINGCLYFCWVFSRKLFLIIGVFILMYYQHILTVIK